MNVPTTSQAVKIIRKTPRYVVVHYMDRDQTVQLPLQFFRKRLAMGLFEVVNNDEFSITEKS